MSLKNKMYDYLSLSWKKINFYFINLKNKLFTIKINKLFKNNLFIFINYLFLKKKLKFFYDFCFYFYFYLFFKINKNKNIIKCLDVLYIWYKKVYFSDKINNLVWIYYGFFKNWILLVKNLNLYFLKNEYGKRRIKENIKKYFRIKKFDFFKKYFFFFKIDKFKTNNNLKKKELFNMFDNRKNFLQNLYFFIYFVDFNIVMVNLKLNNFLFLPYVSNSFNKIMFWKNYFWLK